MVSEPAHVPDYSASDIVVASKEADQNVVEKSYDVSDHERQLGNQKEPVSESPPPSHGKHGNDVSFVLKMNSTTNEQDAAKKSYVSIVS